MSELLGVLRDTNGKLRWVYACYIEGDDPPMTIRLGRFTCDKCGQEFHDQYFFELDNGAVFCLYCAGIDGWFKEVTEDA